MTNVEARRCICKVRVAEDRAEAARRDDPACARGAGGGTQLDGRKDAEYEAGKGATETKETRASCQGTQAITPHVMKTVRDWSGRAVPPGLACLEWARCARVQVPVLNHNAAEKRLEIRGG